MKLNYKKIASKLHLWLGLGCGLIVCVSLTAAAIFVWELELTDWYHHQKVFVPATKDSLQPFNTLLASAQQALPDEKINGVEIQNDAKRSYVFFTYQVDKNPGWYWGSAYKYRSNIYVDPYTAKVLGVVDLRYDWIYCLRMLHQCLLIQYDIGHYFVGFSTLFIIVSVITGLILWFPKNKAALKQRVWFKWKSTTRWKRKNYDIHNIGGFYTFLLILLFAVTGLVWTFDWWTNSIYRLLGNDPKKVFPKVPDIVSANNQQRKQVVDYAISESKDFEKKWTSIFVNLPENEKRPDKITVFLRFKSGTSAWDESHQLVFNSFTGQLYFATSHDKKTLGAKWRNSNYAIHVGSIFGIGTKILACFVALFCASLPVTGFYIWWGRKKKKKLARQQV